MKILMIHEVTEEILKIPKSKFLSFGLITFDDGLYSQFLNRKFFYDLDIPLVYFISSSIICPEGEKQSKQCISCSEAHSLFFEHKNLKHYMKMSQIRTLQFEGCEIGSHNHSHKYYTDFNDFKNNLNTSLDYFESFGLKISKYCSPYNQDYKLGEMYVKSKGLEYFGAERIDIKALINT